MYIHFNVSRVVIRTRWDGFLLAAGGKNLGPIVCGMEETLSPVCVCVCQCVCALNAAEYSVWKD